MKQLIKLEIALVIAFTFSLLQINAQTTHELTPIADATSFSSSFHGAGEVNIKVDADLGRISFLRFDLSGINGTIEQADLALTLQGFNGSGVGLGVVNVYKCLDTEWSEGSVFSSRPSYSSATDQLNTNTVDQFPTLDIPYTWDLGVSKLSTGGFITIALEKAAGKNNFYSINHASTQFHPKLTLVVNESATPSCNDGIQNGDETGIDCGGSCTACDTGNNNGVSLIEAPASIKNGDDEIVLDVSSKAAGSELSIQGRNGQGRTIVNIIPYGDDYRAFLNVKNDSDSENTGSVRLGTRNRYGILSATYQDGGSLANEKKTTNVAIELDPGNKFTGELFQISANGFVDDGYDAPDEKILFHVQEDGKVGIGTTAPEHNLHIVGTGMLERADGGPASLILNKTTGKSVALVAGGTGSTFRFDETGSFKIQAQQPDELLAGTGVTTLRTLMEVNGSAPDYSMVLNADGNLGIGTQTPTAKLTVAGQVLARRVTVTETAGGADFVFEKDYQLPTLEEVAAFVKSKKHLPEIPSAKEMEENGLDLATFNIKLLQKVEELTLYLIEMQEVNKRQEEELEALREKVEELED